MGLISAPVARCGGLVSATAAAWDSSSTSLVIASGRHVRVHPVPPTTSRRPRTLAGHNLDVIGVVSIGPARVLSASKDGTLRIWDTEEAVCLRTLDVGEPITSVATPAYEDKEWDGLVVVACSRNVQLVSVVEKTVGKHVLWQMGVFNIACSDNGMVIAGSVDKVLFLARRRGGVMKAGKGRRSFVEALSLSFTVNDCITAVAVSPDGRKVAVGDAQGVVYVFQDFDEDVAVSGASKLKRRRASIPVPSKLHWHANAVQCLSFVANGTRLLSGGSEAVLVSWDMSRIAFGNRSFRPRLGGTLWGLAASPNERMIAVTCADNAVRVLDSLNLNLMAAFQGLAVPPVSSSFSGNGISRYAVLNRVRSMSIVSDPGHDGCVLVAGIGGSVQLYDVYRGEHVGFFPIVPRNQVFTGPGLNVRPHNPTVLHVAMSKNRESMATVDVERFAEDHEILRFWQRCHKTGETLNPVSRIENPHGVEGKVTGVVFHPDLPIVATSSSVGTVKIWRLVDTLMKQNRLTWRCELVRKHRGSACNSVSLSSDGSLLAVAAGNTVELWRLAIDAEPQEPDRKMVSGSVLEDSPPSVSLELMHTFVHPPVVEPVLDVTFVDGPLPAVVSTTKHGVYVWNVLAQCIWWSLRLMTGKKSISVDSALRRFAISVRLPKTRMEEQSKKGRGKRNNAVAKKGIETPEKLANCADGLEKLQSKVESSSGANASKSKNSQTSSTKRHGAQLFASGSGGESMDKGLVVFDVSSPIPLCVHRVPNGNRVLTTSFVALPNKSATSQESVSPLVYIDSNLEVHMIASDLDSDVLSAVTATEDFDKSAIVEPDSVNRLGKLLGPDWRDAARERGCKVAATARSAPGVKRSLSKSFAGATHTQAPLAKSAITAISSLLHEIRLPNEADLGTESPASVDGEKNDVITDESWDGRGVRAGGAAGLNLRAPPIRPPAALTSMAGRVERMSRWASLAEEDS